MDIQSELEALREASTATAEEVEQVVDDESTAPTEDAVSDTEEEVETEESAPDEESDADETEEADDEVADSFDDLLDDIPTPEAILKTHTRIPQATKDDLVKFADGWRSTRDTLNKVGGELGVELLAPVANVLVKASLTPEEGAQALIPMFQANPSSVSDMIATGATALLFNTDPQYKEFSDKGDAILQLRFGDGYDADRLGRLVALEQSGYINADEDYSTLQAQGSDSTLFQTQQEKLATQEKELKRLTNLVENPHLIEQQNAQQQTAVKAFDAELTNKVNESVSEVLKRGRWDEKSPLAQLVMRDVLSTLKDTDSYKQAVALASQQGTQAELSYPLKAHLAVLSRQAQGKFSELVQAINKDRRQRDETSVNAVVKEKVKETKPKAETLKELDIDTPYRGIAELRQKRDAAIAAAMR